MKHYNVVAAIIEKDHRILCVQRNKNKYDYISYKFEFPGGKIESDESAENALLREIKEELGIDIQIKQHYLTVEHQYPDFKLTMLAFLCTTNFEVPVLTEHIAFRWLERSQLQQLDWAAADIPIVECLKKDFND